MYIELYTIDIYLLCFHPLKKSTMMTVIKTASTRSADNGQRLRDVCHSYVNGNNSHCGRHYWLLPFHRQLPMQAIRIDIACLLRILLVYRGCRSDLRYPNTREILGLGHSIDSGTSYIENVIIYAWKYFIYLNNPFGSKKFWPP